MEREVRVETAYLDDAETVIVAFGTPSKFVRYAIGRLREAGHKIGMVRPITLWPFPYDTVRDAAASARVDRLVRALRGPDDRRRAHRRGGPGTGRVHRRRLDRRLRASVSDGCSTST